MLNVEKKKIQVLITGRNLARYSLLIPVSPALSYSTRAISSVKP